MNIIQHNWAWAHALAQRSATEAIVLHHAAAKTASPEDVHRWHLHNGWAGIGYHIYVRKDGSVHAGRPLWASGAHVLNRNSRTLGVCCEGDYDTETDMPEAQLAALRAAIAYLKTQYPDAAVKLHREYNATACPGRFFPVAAALETGGASPASTTTPESNSMFDSERKTGEAERKTAGSVVSLPGGGMERARSDEKEDSMQRYNTVSELPEAYRAAVQTLIDKGFLKGRGDGALDLSEDMARVLVICARMEGVA